MKQLAQEFLDVVQAYKSIIIHRHVRPDPDAIGSQLGLKAWLEEHFPDKRVLAAGSTSQGLAWMGAMDRVQAQDYEGALVIVCDTANQDRIDGRHYTKGAHLVKIDHHLVVDAYGDLQIVDPQASSTCQILVELLKPLDQDYPLNTSMAQLLYAGLVGDTGRFMFSTGPRAFQAAAYLTQFDFDLRAIHDRFEVMSIDQARFQAHAFSDMVQLDPGVAYIIVSREDLEAFNLTEEETQIIVNLPAKIQGIRAWVTFVEQEPGSSVKYRARIRSKGPKVNQIAEAFHGGGHPMASGANAYSEEDLQGIVQGLVDATREYIKKEGLDDIL